VEDRKRRRVYNPANAIRVEYRVQKPKLKQMKFEPEKYVIPDEQQKPFINVAEIEDFLRNAKPGKSIVREIISKSLDKHRLNLREVATLINADDRDLIDEIKEGASTLKKAVYGNRIVLFAPLYVGNKCITAVSTAASG